MITGPKYKLARRLGAPIFEKTQTQKYALNLSRKERNGKVPQRPKTEFGRQLLEKQKARFTYSLTEKQFSKYVKEVLEKKDSQGKARLFTKLEMRLDNTVYRTGFRPTRLASRQAVSHGHVTVNGKKVTIPSYAVKVGDIISVRLQSRPSPMFATLAERAKDYTPPGWLTSDFETMEAKVTGVPDASKAEMQFDMDVVLEYYSR